MTLMVVDVRELTFDEVEFVSGARPIGGVSSDAVFQSCAGMVTAALLAGRETFGASLVVAFI